MLTQTAYGFVSRLLAALAFAVRTLTDVADAKRDLEHATQ
jgi:hypothetical protein